MSSCRQTLQNDVCVILTSLPPSTPFLHSDAGERLDQIVSVYGNGPRQSSILIRTKPAGGNVLTGAALSAAAQLSQRVWAVTANASYMAEPSQRWTWDDLCARIGGKCWYTSLLDAWQYNVTTIQAAAAAPGGIPQDLIRCGQ